jgi:hypothetical protein
MTNGYRGEVGAMDKPAISVCPFFTLFLSIKWIFIEIKAI